MDSKTKGQLVNVLFGFVLGAIFVTMFSSKSVQVQREPHHALTMSSMEDAQFLGPQNDDEPAKRRSGCVFRPRSAASRPPPRTRDRIMTRTGPWVG
mmetsp:Transcript_42329/g.135533  ORF Transcript_42329/g.135533 Transcript_42329/m.135533 type:complete len:96 (+) Transcript_42329:151-438(+)